jgi:hypothetical protein
VRCVGKIRYYFAILKYVVMNQLYLQSQFSRLDYTADLRVQTNTMLNNECQFYLDEIHAMTAERVKL